MTFTLVSNGDPDPAMARWNRWRTSGKAFSGVFSIEADLAGKGQAYDTTASPTPRGTPVQFIARWDRNGQGPVIVAQTATQPGAPFGGALEFAKMKSSGLAAAFGPAPGL